MSNTANVDALCALIATAPTKGTIREVAEFLAARGVLVPLVLTDRQCETLVVEWDSGTFCGEGDGPELLREELERLAGRTDLLPPRD